MYESERESPLLYEDVIKVILRKISEVYSHDWLHIKLTCKTWRQIGDEMFDPSLNKLCVFNMALRGSILALNFLARDERVPIEYFASEIVVDVVSRTKESSQVLMSIER